MSKTTLAFLGRKEVKEIPLEGSSISETSKVRFAAGFFENSLPVRSKNVVKNGFLQISRVP